MKNIEVRSLVHASIPLSSWLEFILFPLVPPILIRFSLSFRVITTIDAQLLVLVATFLGALSITVYRLRTGIWKKNQLGFKAVSWSGIKSYAVFAAAGSGAILLYGFITRGTLAGSEDTMLRYSIIGSTMQTFLYQCWLMKLGNDIFTVPAVHIGVNTIMFAVMHHVIYPDNVELAYAVVPGGLIFAWLYDRYPNFLLASLLHMAYNACAALAGIIK